MSAVRLGYYKCIIITIIIFRDYCHYEYFSYGELFFSQYIFMCVLLISIFPYDI